MYLRLLILFIIGIYINKYKKNYYPPDLVTNESEMPVFIYEKSDIIESINTLPSITDNKDTNFGPSEEIGGITMEPLSEEPKEPNKSSDTACIDSSYLDSMLNCCFDKKHKPENYLDDETYNVKKIVDDLEPTRGENFD